MAKYRIWICYMGTTTFHFISGCLCPAQEVETMVQMTETGIIPACAKDAHSRDGIEK